MGLDYVLGVSLLRLVCAELHFAYRSIMALDSLLLDAYLLYNSYIDHRNVRGLLRCREPR